MCRRIISSLYAKGILEIMPGEYRNVDLSITDVQHVPPAHEEISMLMFDFFRWYESLKDKMHPVFLVAETLN